MALSARARAVTSTDSVPSTFSGNGHNMSFDGRLFIVRDSQGWTARILRPEATTYRPDGLPDAEGPMWSDKAILLPAAPDDIVENALAICQPDADRAPYSCNEAGDAALGGPYDCYEVWLIDSDAVTAKEEGGATMRRRQLLLWVADPKSATARVHKFELSSTLEPLSPTIRGIEPTVTEDGKLLVWQGHPDNDGTIDIIMYSVNENACAASGWSPPASISHMAVDPLVLGVYRLAERTLRAADGTVFADNQLVHGAYPWLMPNGDALVFQASLMPCRGEEDPPGCGPRRNSFSVVGYPTNWGVAIIDGGVNPSTTDTVRLFFSSPGPSQFAQFPITPGADVWPFFGSNTHNYAELIFDDGIDGNYAAFWHFNESVGADGAIDLSKTPDVSGYFNTGALRGGLEVSKINNGVLGRALELDGVDDRVEVDHSITLNPVNGITVDFWIRPTADPDCDGNNNYRFLLGKGDIASGTYSVVVEQDLSLHVRFNVEGQQQSLLTEPLTLGEWTHVSCEYDGPSGNAGCWFDDVAVVEDVLPVGTLVASTADLLIGAPGARDVCPNGDGAFAGMLDELSISRYARRLGEPPVAEDLDGGIAGSDGGAGAGVDAGDGGGGQGGGCGCSSGVRASWFSALLLGLATWLAADRMVAWRRRRRR